MSSSGRTAGFEPANGGSNPPTRAKFVCGEDFCDYCGDCMYCNEEFPCFAADPEGSEPHVFVPDP